MIPSGTAPPDDEPLRAAPVEQDLRPVVALPRQGLPGAIIAALALVAALVLFLILNGERRSHATAALNVARPAADAFAPPPPLVVPPEPAPPPPRTVTVVTQPAPPILPARPQPVTPTPPTAFQPVIVPQPPQPIIVPLAPERPARRRDEPAIVFDNGPEDTTNPPAGSSADQSGRVNRVLGGAGAGLGGDTAPARATLIGDKTGVMPVGTIIPAVLETPIDTARPGLVRAAVSRDTRGFDGRRVLVPGGSRLIGEYQADVRANQNRVLVTWTRLIRPDGVTIQLGSPASDVQGGAGVPGRLHSYFFQRFASAVLQSALTVGVNLASRPGNNSVIVGLPGTTVNNVLGQNLPSQNSIQPKITVKQGAAVNVFVARDLDFSGVPSRP